MKKLRKLVLKPEQLMSENEMEEMVAGCFVVAGCGDLLLNMFSDVCRCTKSGNYHNEYAVFKVAKNGNIPPTNKDDYFYGHPAGSPIDERDKDKATYREEIYLMRYYKISIPGINGGAQHVKEDTTTKYYE